MLRMFKKMTLPTTPLLERAPWALVIGREPFFVRLGEPHQYRYGHPAILLYAREGLGSSIRKRSPSMDYARGRATTSVDNP